MVPVAVPPTEALICTFLSGAGPEEGDAVVVTERVLSAGAVALQVPEPEHSYPELHSPTLLHLVQEEGFEGVEAEQAPLHPIEPVLILPQVF